MFFVGNMDRSRVWVVVELFVCDLVSVFCSNLDGVILE